MRKFGLSVMVVLALATGACNTMQNAGTKEVVGTGAGAVLGGVLGSKIGGGSGKLWATGAGALLGAFIGNEIGSSLDNADRAAADNAAYRAQNAPIGQQITWNNPNSGNHGTITPVRDGYSSSGRYCREYQQEIVVGGKKQSAYGTACQQPDGSWEVVK